MKDQADTQTPELPLNGNVPKRRGRPKTGKALSNAEKQRRYRERKAQGDQAVAYREEAKRLYAQLVTANREVDLCRYERSEAFRVVEIYRQRLEQAGLSTDY